MTRALNPMEMPENLQWWLSGIVVLQVMILFILFGQAAKRDVMHDILLKIYNRITGQHDDD